MNEQNSQVLVALAIVGAMAVVAIGTVIAGAITGNWSIAVTAIGPIVGALATALNTPSGVSAALAAANKKPTPTPDPQQQEPTP